MQMLYEDHDIVVVNKPAGLLSVPGRGPEKQDSCEYRIRQQHAGAMAVHRLDMATSGVLVIAKHKEAERHYKQCFAERLTEKHYIAVCHGLIDVDEGEMTEPLICDWPNRPRQKVCFETGKAALTRFAVLSRKENTTRVALYPYTGRSHQLRVHLAYHGHPILGDKLYGYPEDLQKSRLLLHAEYLAIPNRENQLLSFRAPTPF